MRSSVYSNDRMCPLSIYTIGFARNTKVTRFGPGRRDSYIIHYVTKGKGYYNGNLVHAGEGFLIEPKQEVYYYADEDDPWQFLWVISYDDKMKDVFNRYNADKDTKIFSYGSISDVEKMVNTILPKKDIIIDSFEILEMYLHLLNSHTSSKDNMGHKTNEDTYIDFCAEYIVKNIYKKITVDELTKFVGVSQPYLYKIFTKRFNMSPKDYIIWEKIYAAKKMLKETDMKITQIATSVGYDDVLAFSKIFAQKEGMSPLKYRECHSCEE